MRSNSSGTCVNSKFFKAQRKPQWFINIKFYRLRLLIKLLVNLLVNGDIKT